MAGDTNDTAGRGRRTRESGDRAAGNGSRDWMRTREESGRDTSDRDATVGRRHKARSTAEDVGE